jgi:NADH/NAD ratio-sensing transcriptional regulator Rex
LNQEYINNLNTSVTGNEIERPINTLPTKKAQDQANSLLNSTLKEELTPMLFKIFQKIQE